MEYQSLSGVKRKVLHNSADQAAYFDLWNLKPLANILFYPLLSLKQSAFV